MKRQSQNMYLKIRKLILGLKTKGNKTKLEFNTFYYQPFIFCVHSLDHGLRKPINIFTAFSGLIITMLFLTLTCAPTATNVKTLFEQAETAYNKLLTTHPEPEDTQGYRIYMAKAKSAYDNNDFENAERYAKQALEQANNAYSTRLQLQSEAKTQIELTRTKMNNLLVPSHEAIHGFFEALKSYNDGRYRKCISILSDVSKRLDIDAQTAFLNKLTLYVPDYLKNKFGDNIPIFSFLGNDLKLHNQITSVKGPVEVEFVNQFFITEDFSYFHIKIDKLHLDGWVYPQFVIIGKVKG